MDRKVVFISHCILNQNVRANGKERSSGSIKEIVKIFADAEVGIVQLPCPEMEYDGGLNREFRSKETYGKTYRKCCRNLSLKILKDIKSYLDRDYKVLGILGVEFSPTCGVYRLESSKRIIPGRGILTEELEKGMQNGNFQVPIISVNTNNLFSTLERLSILIKNS
jgi:predicted secreted protein